MKTILTSFFLLACFLLACSAIACAQPPGGQGDGIWLRNAYYGEAQTFDRCLGHQPGNGQYHHHVQPICLRAQLEDNLETVGTLRVGTVYREKAAGWKHSPILGWMFDGYPIYGPYGYSDPANPSSAIKRLKPSFRLRTMTQRTSLPDWALARHTGVPQQLSAAQQGPDVSDMFPLGRYIEDHEFVQGLGDLDVHNGRFAVTPEFPNGTYAYFVTINDDGSPAFPYVIGLQFYGNVTGGGNAAAPANAQGYFNNGTYSQTIPNAPQLNSWLTKNSQQNAQVINGFEPSAGPQPTWPVTRPTGAQVSGGQATAVKADSQNISFTDAAVYLTANGLGSYTMGPWFIDGGNGGVFMNFPTAQNVRAQFPRNPSAAATKRNTTLGAIGLWVNGVAVFDGADGSSYSNANRNDVGGGTVRLSSIHVSAASFEGGPTAPGALMAAFPMFGAKLATSTAGASSPAWPTTLAGASVNIRDAAGTNHAATISYASPTQLNYRVPDNAAIGLATVTITAGGVSIPGAINIASAYPNLFNIGSDSIVAGYVLRARSNGQQVIEPIYDFSGASNNAFVPIDLGADSDIVYLVFFGSGLGRNPQVSVSIGGVTLTPAYAGPQGTFTGLDQYNVPLPRSLAGKGKVGLVITADGRASNQANVSIK
ncbi:MAG: YHYH protein [Acidobacteria bacterium]|nr:YHYH protein [Acidobacteriota bacterium]